MGTNILIVDDETSMERLVKRIFRQEVKEEGYELIYFNTADEAYQYLNHSNDVDIVLLDINMPGKLDGLALLSEIRKLNPLIKVVMISAYGDMMRSRMAMQNGAFDFLEKPIDPDELRFVVRRGSEYVSETKKVSNLLNKIDSVDFFANNDIVDFFKHEIIASASGECKREIASILITGIRDFSRNPPDRDPPLLVKRLNEYLTEFTKIVYMFNGYIDKFISSYMVAVFPGPRNYMNAVKAALKVREKMSALNKVKSVNNVQPLSGASGVIAGEIIVGNIGSTDPVKLERTVIGEVVYFCLKLQALAGDGQVLVVKNRFSGDDPDGCTFVKRTVGGIEGEVFEVTGG